MTEIPPGPRIVTRWPQEAGWSGIPTFMKLPLCFTPDDLIAGQADVAIAGEPWDGTAISYSGARMGPRAIRTVDSLMNPPLERPHQHVRVDSMEHLTVYDYGDCDIVVGDSMATFARMKDYVAGILSADVVPILLGGDHSVAWPNISAAAEHLGSDQLGVVHIDAHTDTADECFGNTHNNSTPFRRLLEDGAVRGPNLHQIGLRGYWPGANDIAWLDSQGVRCHFMAEVDDRGIDAVLDDVFAELRESGITKVWLSFDIDAVDPAWAPGTGSPEPGGLSSREALRIARRVCAEVGIIGMDLVEVNPSLDSPANITALLAHRIVLEALTGTAMRKTGLTTPKYVHPLASP